MASGVVHHIPRLKKVRKNALQPALLFNVLLLVSCLSAFNTLVSQLEARYVRMSWCCATSLLTLGARGTMKGGVVGQGGKDDAVFPNRLG